jgi:hypothetical protein
LTSTKRVNGRKPLDQEVEKRNRSRSTTVNRGTEAKEVKEVEEVEAKAEEAQAEDSDLIAMESGLLVAKEVAVEEGAAVPAPVDPTEAKASLLGTAQAVTPMEIQGVIRATEEDKTTRATADDSTHPLNDIKKAPTIELAGAFY